MRLAGDGLFVMIIGDDDDDDDPVEDDVLGDGDDDDSGTGDDDDDDVNDDEDDEGSEMDADDTIAGKQMTSKCKILIISTDKALFKINNEVTTNASKKFVLVLCC